MMPMIRAMESTTIPRISPMLVPPVSSACLLSVVTFVVAESVKEINISTIQLLSVFKILIRTIIVLLIYDISKKVHENKAAKMFNVKLKIEPYLFEFSKAHIDSEGSLFQFWSLVIALGGTWK